MHTQNATYTLITLTLLTLALPTLAQTPTDTLALIPLPVSLERTGGAPFTLTAATAITTSDHPEAQRIARYLADHLRPATGLHLPVVPPNVDLDAASSVSLILSSDVSTLGSEGYQLTISPNAVRLTASAPAGLFYAVQTLLQLLPPQIEADTPQPNTAWTVPALKITDQPRFAWRGILLDVSRHFFTKQEVMQFIDRMARYKLNTLHLHLTDDQGWRIEIKARPKLTEIGAWRVPRVGNWWKFDPPQPNEKPTYGGFYTHDDIRQLVAYAQDRFITIVPEIDVPGHSLATLASYPELACTEGPFHVNPGSPFYGKIQNTLCVAQPEVYDLLDDVFGEIAQLFPGQYIHMGGDEAHKGFWAKCPRCQTLKKEKELQNENELQSYFVKRCEEIINRHGKRLIGWDEILEGGLAPNATVMSWRGLAGGVKAAQMNHHVVMSPSPHYYLDLFQGDPVIEPPTYSLSRLNTCYTFDPVPPGVDPALILGIQGNLWTESVPTLRHAQYMIWPRGLAIAETAWSPASRKDWNTFHPRVTNHFQRLDAAHVNYAPSMYDPIFTPRKDADGNLLIELATEIDDLTIHYCFDGTFPDQFYPKYTQPLAVPRNALELRTITCRKGQPIGRPITMPITELQNRAK